MADNPLTGLQTSGSVSSRFVSQSELDEAKKKKEEEWKAAYARIGQEPPPPETEGEYDPRSLYERLSVQKETKKEEWDEKMRMANQFRGLEADELQFLDETARTERERQRKVEMQDAEQLAAFKQLQHKQSAMISPPIEDQRTTLAPTQTQPSGPKPSTGTTAPSKKNVRSLLKGVIKKKDAKSKGPGPVEPVSTAPLVAPPSDVKPPAAVVTAATTSKDVQNSNKRPAPALGALGGYDSDSEASDAAETSERESKKVKV